MKVLVLGGGGMLGAFSAGALAALEAAGYRPDALIGSSAGGINLLRFLVGGAREAAAFWERLDFGALLADSVRHNVLRDGLLNPTTFAARVDEGVDYGALLRDRRPVAFIVCDLETGRVRVRGNRTEGTEAALRGVAHAGYALPPLFPPVRVGAEVLADGGFLHNAPLEAAAKLGATEIVYLCNITALPVRGFARPSIFRTTLRYFDIFARRASNVGFADAEIEHGAYRGVPFVAITPSADVRFAALLRAALPRKQVVAELVDAGRAAAARALAEAQDGSFRRHRSSVTLN